METATPAVTPASTPSDEATTTPATIATTPTTETLISHVEAEPSRPEWLSSKYKTAEDQAKAYPELYKMYLEKNEVPEKYDLDSVLQEANISIRDPAQYDALTSELRDLGINNKQAQSLMKRFGSELTAIVTPLQQQLQDLAPKNLAEERGKLEQEWGERTNANLDQIGKWAKSNLTKDVAEALGRSANGIKFVQSLMNGEKGPVPISNTTNPGVDVADLRGRVQDIMKDADYNKNTDKGRALQQQAYIIHKQIRQVEGKPFTTKG